MRISFRCARPCVTISGYLLLQRDDRSVKRGDFLHQTVLRDHADAYTEEFHYTFAIEEEAENICIPKLIIQPLVENAFKYAFDKQPPWELTISASIEHDRWLLQSRTTVAI